MVVSAGQIRSLADRLHARAASILSDQPEGAGDLITASRFLKHAVRVGWIVTTVALVE
jgi:hypothetical protein